jgi:hypothetical protein
MMKRKETFASNEKRLKWIVYLIMKKKK